MASTAKHGWPMVRLGDVCEISIGKTPARKNPEYWGKGHPWLSIRDMNQGRSLSATAEQITDLAVRETSPRLCEPGTVLFSFKLSIGKVGIAQIPLYTNEAIAAFVPLEAKTLLNEYLFHALQYFGSNLEGQRAVMGQTLNKASLSQITIPLPPLEEQRRIAAILDEARGQRDKYAGAGTLLGTMTSNWLSLRSQSIPRMKLSELGTFRGGMTPSKKNSEYWGGDVPWFTTKDLKFAEVYESEDRITHRALDETSASLIGEPSIAFSLRGMSLAHRLPMSCIPGEVTVNQDLKAFVPNQSKDRDVLFYLVKLREKELLSKVSSSAHGTKKLDFRHLNELEVPDPSGEFGSEVRRVLEQIRDMQEQIRRRQETSMTLFQALSTRAFQGEL
ncbi:restriction endonuclease subunit S [Corynebacterium striatum]|uniref:restriction endonuclease subunit S n=2 Tax=Corynebacterium striatum TaxID=43770 RepID=UPI000D7206D4|nr:restriction endonuclease subunit S [Corynebacterium striatum]PXY03400.1 hypothetical protein CKF53_14325 [Corynebacterium striatum]PXY11995.1 hypothetical protein CKF74_10515 [Corynebacterium striatum]PXY16444.1 hypothetical protein CKF62_00990 [Corynebacterium striatum]